MSGQGKGADGIVGVWRLAKTSATGDDGAPMPPGESVREYMSYCGNYTWDGKTLVTRVDASVEAKRVGGEQTRFTHFEDGLLVLTQKPRPWQGKMQHRALYWERVAAAG